jgi:predicted phosphoribosyltransferase
VFVVRKLGLPGHPELAMGAIAAGGVRVLNADVIAENRISDALLADVEAKQQAELERRERVYRQGRPPLDVRGRTVLLVDDGLATGATMRVAIQAIRVLAPARVVMAVPVGSRDTCRDFQSIADEVVCAHSPEDLVAVGLWYRNFAQTTDEEIHDLLRNEQ